MLLSIRHIFFALAGMAILLQTGCAQKGLIGDPQLPYPPAAPPQIGQIMHLPTGVLVSEQEMLDIVTANRIIYAGETHDNPASHRLQLTILKAMADRHPGKVALGMEMFTPAQNEALRKWVNGELSEKAFLKEAAWFKVWKDDFDYYRDILLFARDRKIPVLGLNADKATVRLVAAGKIEELPPEVQKTISVMDLDDPYQRGLVEGIYGGHVKSEGMLEGFHRVQTLWDETMAESVVNFLKDEAHSDYHMMVMAGGNHVRYGFGIPRRVFRRVPLSYTLVGGREIEIPESKKDRLMDVTLPSFPMPPYEFMAFLRYEDLDKDEVKLGVMMDEQDGKVVITGVAPNSNAARAGMQKGDVLVAIDGDIIEDTFDVVYAIKKKTAGDRGTVVVNREDKPVEFNVEFLKQEQSHHGKE